MLKNVHLFIKRRSALIFTETFVVNMAAWTAVFDQRDDDTRNQFRYAVHRSEAGEWFKSLQELVTDDEYLASQTGHLRSWHTFSEGMTEALEQQYGEYQRAVAAGYCVEDPHRDVEGFLETEQEVQALRVAVDRALTGEDPGLARVVRGLCHGASYNTSLAPIRDNLPQPEGREYTLLQFVSAVFVRSEGKLTLRSHENALAVAGWLERFVRRPPLGGGWQTYSAGPDGSVSALPRDRYFEFKRFNQPTAERQPLGRESVPKWHIYEIASMNGSHVYDVRNMSAVIHREGFGKCKYKLGRDKAGRWWVLAVPHGDKWQPVIEEIAVELERRFVERRHAGVRPQQCR